MSSFPTVPTSTTVSSASSRSRADWPVAVIACGALAAHIREITTRRGWPVELHILPALLHNRPSQIPSRAKRLAQTALSNGQRVAVAYADCGTYGGLDEVCSQLGLRRLPGLHCYDVLAGPDEMRAAFEAEPGTYCSVSVLTGDSFKRHPASADFLQDLLGGGGPHERLGVVVVGLEVFLDGGDQIGDGFEHPAADRFVGEVAEPALHEVQPGTR